MRDVVWMVSSINIFSIINDLYDDDDDDDVCACDMCMKNDKVAIIIIYDLFLLCLYNIQTTTTM